MYYGSFTIQTALAECAYYRLVFWAGMEVPPPSNQLFSQHTSFSVDFDCSPGVELHQPPFLEQQDLLLNKQDYRASQQLGNALRQQGVQGFSYRSARCPNSGLNGALFTPDALVSNKPKEKQAWVCTVTGSCVEFKCMEGRGGASATFAAAAFFVGGEIPVPAA
ncbi:putative RES domain-containing protein [Magnetofaba australis IT-1]|uniref:Putative RES domain-containing protein n=1 Tax=Magnetofaba australis IT-1 TaxID=1434232 RepID=A0A1Y2KAF9_9PROT|nr:putative RES domain-containing protein [Magnetofaba australis IT-1]